MQTAHSDRAGRKPGRNQQYLAAMDRAQHCCANIATVAGFLECCEMEKLNPETIAGSGLLLAGEAAVLRELLAQFHRQLRNAR